METLKTSVNKFMKTQTKFTDKQLKEFRDVIVKSGRNTISNLQVRCGLGYQDAKLVFGLVNEDKKLIAQVLKYQTQKPILIKKYVDESIRIIKKIKNKDYVEWNDVRIKVGIKYEFDRDVKDRLRKEGYISDKDVYLIENKK